MFKVGTNLSEVAYYNEQYPFNNCFKSAPSWICYNTNSTVWKIDVEPEVMALFLGGNGYIKRMPVAADNVTFNAFKTIIQPGVSGEYRVKFLGEGEIKYSVGAKLLKVISANEHLISINSSVHPVLAITNVNPLNNIRDISVVKADLSTSNPIPVFNAQWLSKIESYDTVRFMDWMSTNNSEEVEWAERSKVSNATYSTVPVEIMVQLCNLTKQNAWFCMPHLSTEEYVTKFAEYVRDNLDPNLLVYVEYSNEAWNPQFKQFHWLKQQAEAIGLKGRDLFSKLSSRNALIFKNVFGSRASSVRGVMGAQGASVSVLKAELDFRWDPNRVTNPIPQTYGIDVGSPATYFNVNQSTTDEQLLQWANSGEAGLTALFDKLRENIVNITNVNSSEHRALCTAKGIELAAYEGGQHLATITASRKINSPEILAMYFAANRDPRMKELYILLINAWVNIGGDLWCHFKDVSPQSKFGSWGALESIYSTSYAPKYEAIMQFV